jgi:hypothetical protein
MQRMVFSMLHDGLPFSLPTAHLSNDIIVIMP